MTITRRRLEEAAFWHIAVCLDCQGLAEIPEDEPPQTVCPACGSTKLLPAETILACADLIEAEDD